MFCHNHLCCVGVKLWPQLSVAQKHCRFRGGNHWVCVRPWVRLHNRKWVAERRFTGFCDIKPIVAIGWKINMLSGRTWLPPFFVFFIFKLFDVWIHVWWMPISGQMIIDHRLLLVICRNGIKIIWLSMQSVLKFYNIDILRSCSVDVVRRVGKVFSVHRLQGSIFPVVFRFLWSIRRVFLFFVCAVWVFSTWTWFNLTNNATLALMQKKLNANSQAKLPHARQYCNQSAMIH